jgi:hypothetical protein
MTTQNDKNETVTANQNCSNDGYYWPNDENGNELFALGVSLAIMIGGKGFDLKGPIRPEVAEWVLRNLPRALVGERQQP